VYVGKTLISHLASFSNVDTVFKLYGHGRGGYLVHRILSEIKDPRITRAISCTGSPTTEQMSTLTTSITRRHFLGLYGGQDTGVPATGGEGTGGLIYADWEETSLMYARAFGYSGDQVSRSRDDDDVAQVSYLDGRVQGYLCKTCGHAIDSADAEIIAFLEGSSQVTGPDEDSGTARGNSTMIRIHSLIALGVLVCVFLLGCCVLRSSMAQRARKAVSEDTPLQDSKNEDCSSWWMEWPKD
jgi:hypothetical protein